MAFEKIKNFFKKVNEIDKYQFKGRKSYMPFLFIIFFIPFVFLSLIKQIFILFIYSVIVYFLMCLSILKIEEQKYKKFPFQKLIKKFIKIDEYLKNQNKLRIFLSLLVILILFAVFSFCFIYGILVKSYMSVELTLISLLILIFVLCSFIYDLILLAKDKFINRNKPEQLELKEEADNE